MLNQSGTRLTRKHWQKTNWPRGMVLLMSHQPLYIVDIRGYSPTGQNCFKPPTERYSNLPDSDSRCFDGSSLCYGLNCNLGCVHSPFHSVVVRCARTSNDYYLENPHGISALAGSTR